MSDDDALPADVRAWVERAAGRIVVVRPLARASTVLHAVDVAAPGGARRQLVVRRFGDAARLGTDPWYSPANEAAALELLRADGGVRAPRLVAADLDTAESDVPALLTTRLPGRPPARPDDPDRFVRELAHELVAIHAVDAGPAPPVIAYAPYFDAARDGERRPPAWTSQPGLWARVFALLDAAPPDTPAGVIHRDFHQGQTLWASGALTGVVDWTTCCVGPRGIDLARMQLNLLELDAGLAERFVAAHAAIAGEVLRHPHWDLLDAADAILDRPAPRNAAERASAGRFEAWVARAVAELGG